MTTDLATRPSAAAASAAASDARDASRVLSSRRVLLVVVAALVSILLAVALGGGAVATTDRVAISFPGEPDAVVSDWGNEEVYGAIGSHVLLYQHGHTTTMRVPWDGPTVTGVRLGDDVHNLLTVTGMEQADDALLLGVRLGNCRYFHERAIDIYTDVRLTLARGGDVLVPFDKPLLVKSPMLASCPDRTLDRGDDARGETFRRGG